MQLVMKCIVVDQRGFKERITLPLEYKSKEKCIHDFMQLAKANYKKRDYNYGRGAYFMFMGYRFEAHTYYYEFSDGSPQLETPPAIYTLKEWFNKCQMKEN